MEDKRIQNLVREVFKKAEQETVSHTRYALAVHISTKTNLSPKTLERAHNKYVTRTNIDYKLQADSINLLCGYLGYEDFAHYLQRKSSVSNTQKSNVQNDNRKFLLVSAGGLIIIVASMLLWSKRSVKGENILDCMTWADSLYIPVSCDTGPMSENGIPILPLDKVKMKNFKKVEVDMATRFFSESTGKPLIWYYTKNEDETEYYTAPGLHPITGMTLKAITEHIIMTRVPMHKVRKESYFEE